VGDHPSKLPIIPSHVTAQVADRRLLYAARPVSVDRPHGHLVAAAGRRFTQHPESHRLAQGQQVLHLFGVQVFGACAGAPAGFLVLSQNESVSLIADLAPDPGGPDGHLDQLYLPFIQSLLHVQPISNSQYSILRSV